MYEAAEGKRCVARQSQIFHRHIIEGRNTLHSDLNYPSDRTGGSIQVSSLFWQWHKTVD